MKVWSKIRQPPWRTIALLCVILLCSMIAYWLWSPGLVIRDGRHDRGHNAIWISHAWLGDDVWFKRYGKDNDQFRTPDAIRTLAAKLRAHHVRDVFPHLCPADVNGRILATDTIQTEKFLDEFADFRVMPWIGGPNGSAVSLGSRKWSEAFLQSVRSLMDAHPRFAGVHLNVEPLTSGDTDFLELLEKLKATLPPGKQLSVAAYPPPTIWQPIKDVHWDKDYFTQVAKRCDQMVVMMYDTSLRSPKLYQSLMASWTSEVLRWSGRTPVLLGIPTYDDEGVGYHHPRVENIEMALAGIHGGLVRQPLPAQYQGVAIYCDWETDHLEWEYFANHFLERSDTRGNR